MTCQPSTETSIFIKPFDADSESDFTFLYSLWTEVFPDWPIDQDLLGKILRHPFLSALGRHFIAFESPLSLDPASASASTTISKVDSTTNPNADWDSLKAVGFILAYLGDGGKKGYISALGVLPQYRGKGVGSKLLERGLVGLKSAGAAGEELHGDTESGEGMKIVIGSEMPRFWPGLPIGFVEGGGDWDARKWWGRRGFKKPTGGPIIKDLFKDIRTEVVPADVRERVEMIVKEKGLRFAPWDESGYDECMEKQSDNFSWVKAYAVLAASNQYHEVMVAFDAETNEQLGWTLMCGPEVVVKDMFAFMPISGDVAFAEQDREGEGKGERKIGLIAAVGVDEKARGRGVGLAMVVKAMENLKERGVEGIFVDSVTIRDFYEKMGFEMRWEYETWEFVGSGEGKVVESQLNDTE
ncbi:hypothetical protein BKA64DRAFT_728857 [Cadophora sp. MPI-SDFR-AT-0126]|nr:hypothetical protein BKA64DRAFT_728857 [Leotiomycetes sp. MPI-SDFR-AT-0126]